MPQRKGRKGRQKAIRNAKGAKKSPSALIPDSDSALSMSGLDDPTGAAQIEYPGPRLAWSLRPL
jgi:hypothetical protein